MAVPPILIIEDDPTIAVFMEWALTQEGHRVVVAPTVEAALDAVDRESPGLILMDMNLPAPVGGEAGLAGRVGAHLYRALRERRVVAPMIAVTADARAAEAALAEGITDILLKPFDIDDLFDLVNRYTGQPNV